MKKFFIFVLVIMVVSVGAVSSLLASGFFIYNYDAKAQGQAGAFTAQADNPSAIFYNPAGISQLDGTQVSVGTEFIRLETEYENVQGLKEDMQAGWEVVPNAYITSDFGTEKWTFGLGFYAPFGLSTSWKDDGLLRYVATDTSLEMININPTVAYQLLPELSVAAGIDYYNMYSYVAKSKFNFVIADADGELESDDDGWGFNVAGLWKPHPKHSIGLSYRSKVDLTLTGDSTIENIPAGLGLPSSISNDVSGDLTLPSIVNAGYAFKPTDKLKLELDVYWVEWSTIDEEVVEDRNTGMTLINNPKDWDDTWIISVGGEYLVNSQLALRAGYSYQQNAVPESTFNPNVPDSDLHVIGLGLGYTIDRFTIDAAYSFGFYDERDITNTVGAALGTTVNGKYDSIIHVIGVTIGYKF